MNESCLAELPTAGSNMKDLNCWFKFEPAVGSSNSLNLAPDEVQLNLKPNYTSSNCYFECKLNWAWERLNCTPWYFPPVEDSAKFCDPWDTLIFMTELDQVPNTRCSHCLPDCEYTSYKVSLSSAPFRY